MWQAASNKGYIHSCFLHLQYRISVINQVYSWHVLWHVGKHSLRII